MHQISQRSSFYSHGDYDLAGRLDLFQANGHLEDEINKVQPSQHYRQPAQLFWNAGTGGPHTFVPIDGQAVGDLAKPLVGRGAAYNDFDGDPKWVEIATPIARLLIDKGRTPDGDWFFSLNADGSPKKASQRIYVNAFCTYGLTEFARATGDSESLDVSLDSF